MIVNESERDQSALTRGALSKSQLAQRIAGNKYVLARESERNEAIEAERAEQLPILPQDFENLTLHSSSLSPHRLPHLLSLLDPSPSPPSLPLSSPPLTPQESS